MIILNSAWHYLCSLGYNSPVCPLEDKPKKKETKILLGGSQEGKIGPTHHQTMMSTLQKIQQNREPGVYFNRNSLVNYLYGGTCTAMVLGFIEDFLNSKGADLQKRLITTMKNYTISGEVFRAQQIAFNTIEQSHFTQSSDFKRAKVQSLANFKNFKIDYASTDMELDDILKNPEKFEQEIEKLPEGIYFLRILRPSDNHKKEHWGHSTVFLRDKIEGDYFYDPNYGLTEIADGETAKFFKEHFEILNDVWLVNNPRFYRIKV